MKQETPLRAMALILVLAMAPPATTRSEEVPVFRISPGDGDPRTRGTVLGAEIKAHFPDLEQRYDAFLAHWLTPHQTEAWIAREFDRTRDSLSDELRQEIDGLADALTLSASDRPGDQKLSFEEFWLLQAASALIPMNGGVAFAIDAPLTQSGATLAGRLLDGDAANSLSDLVAVTILENGPETVVLVGPAGVAGITNGYNAHGVFIALIDGPELTTPVTGTRVAALDLREAIAGRRTLEGVVSRLRGGWWQNRSILLADPDRARVLEVPVGEQPRLRGPDTSTRLESDWGRSGQIAAVECFMLPRFPSSCQNLRDIHRWVRMRELATFSAAGPKAGARDLIAILSDRANGRYGMVGPETAALIAFQTRPPTPYLGMGDDLSTPRRYGGLVSTPSSGLLVMLTEGVWLAIAAVLLLAATAMVYARFRR